MCDLIISARNLLNRIKSRTNFEIFYDRTAVIVHAIYSFLFDYPVVLQFTQIVIIRRENPQNRNPILSWIIKKFACGGMEREREVKRFGICLVIGQSIGGGFHSR